MDIVHRRVRLGLRARFPDIQVKLYAQGDDRAGLEERLDRAAEWVVGRLKGTVYSITGRSMPEVVSGLLRRQAATVAVAESCTGGLVGSWLTDVAGSSDIFLLSAVTYANSAKEAVLGVPSAQLDAKGAVDRETARLMAVGVRQLAGATYAIATSGIAGPGGGTDAKPVGTVCIGFSAPGASWGRRYCFPFGGRRMKKQMFAMAALDALRRELQGQPHDLAAMVPDRS
jgi:nicotinamide-nucleotide amidase